MSADQVAAQDEEQIDADPAEAVQATGQFETKKRCVVKDNDDDGERAEKIEARLALAITKARVDSEPEGCCSFGDRFLNGGSVAFKSRN